MQLDASLLNPVQVRLFSDHDSEQVTRYNVVRSAKVHCRLPNISAMPCDSGSGPRPWTGEEAIPDDTGGHSNAVTSSGH